MFGFASGVIIATAPKIIEETVPSHLIDKGFGASTNLAVNFAIMICTIAGTGNPSENDYEALKESSNWQIIYGLPIIFSGI